MIKVNDSKQSESFKSGGFYIQSTYPGINLDNSNDKGLAQLGRIDYSLIKAGTVVSMHRHETDEILSYIRKGKMTHKDSKGNLIEIGSTHLMMMNAGSGIYHEESVPADGEDVEMIQIFIRPESEGLEAKVQFYPLESLNSENKWRLIGGSEKTGAPLTVNSDIRIWDMFLTKDHELEIANSKVGLLYVFSGRIKANGKLMEKADSLVMDENVKIESISPSDLVFFEMNSDAKYSRSGVFSG